MYYMLIEKWKDKSFISSPDFSDEKCVLQFLKV